MIQIYQVRPKHARCERVAGYAVFIRPYRTYESVSEPPASRTGFASGATLPVRTVGVATVAVGLTQAQALKAHRETHSSPQYILTMNRLSPLKER